MKKRTIRRSQLHEIELVREHVDIIIEEGNGALNSKSETATIKALSKVLERTIAAVAQKARAIAVEEGKIVIMKNKNSSKKLAYVIKTPTELKEERVLRNKKILSMSDDGMTVREIAKQTGVTKSSVHEVIQRHRNYEDRTSIGNENVVSVPLKKLYGKVDFETFISLIND